MVKNTFTDNELIAFRKASYMRGFIIGAVLVSIIGSVAFVVFCNSLINL
jgi:hypothetical protein